MKTSKINRISADNLADVATLSAERAMAARKSVGVELNTEEIEAVSGAIGVNAFQLTNTTNLRFHVAGGFLGGGDIFRNDPIGGQLNFIK